MSVSMTWTQYRYQVCRVDGKYVELGPVAHELVTRLLLAPPGHYVPSDEIVNWLWPNPDDEPETAYNILRTMCWRLAKQHGIVIESKYCQRYVANEKARYGGLRLKCRVPPPRVATDEA